MSGSLSEQRMQEACRTHGPPQHCPAPADGFFAEHPMPRSGPGFALSPGQDQGEPPVAFRMLDRPVASNQAEPLVVHAVCDSASYNE